MNTLINAALVMAIGSEEVMRTMNGGFCLHYDCSNRNSFGYCKTTVCINEHYQQKRWGLQSTTNKSESVVIKQIEAEDDDDWIHRPQRSN